MSPTIANASDGIKIKKINSLQKPKSKNLDQYKEFCRLRDYRKPGVEVPQYTEAEAFALATGKFKARPTAITKALPDE